MRFKIDWKQLRADPLHPGCMVIYIIVFGILASVMGGRALRAFPPHPVLYISPMSMSAPYVIAGGLLVGEGIERFSGVPRDYSWGSEHSAILLGILFSFIIAPALLAWGLRARSKWRNRSAPRRSPLLIIVALTLGGYYATVLSFIGLASATMAPRVYATLKSSSAATANLEAIQADLAQMAFKAHVFYFLPTKHGGGGGQWTDIPGREPSMLTLEDMAPPPAPLLARVLKPGWDPQEPSRFALVEVGKDEVVLEGVGTKDGDGDGTPVTVKMWVRADAARDSMGIVHR